MATSSSLVTATLMVLYSLTRAAPTASTSTVYLAGDSTMAPGGGGNGTQGWGEYLAYSLSIPVINKAIGGRSARSFSDEGRFTAIADLVVAGDIVVIEFGHNDGGSLTTTDNGRTDCYGSGNETCTTPDGLVVQTFPTYITAAGKLMTAKGATVIVSSQTPDNPWETGTFVYTPNRFAEYAEISAENIGDGASFVDHGQYTANRFEVLGEETVDLFYPMDHTHTSPEGADVVQRAFVKAIVCGGNGLAAYVVNGTVEGECI
ncbi:carbohydrate esterase family 12 protein [Saccharata proteae CBS 121410]|uniref:Carbohydrate esterase family 12 protein n=1 Tax=Saccharata proteae CBS 121410 TaxID=1314787 RepID=A0A6A5YAJ6_9PEZI|nr:carbohydrate esterase family 12 protein [Saccharata proteae CBS 121410]